MDWGRFQLAALIIIAGLIVAKALTLWFTVRVNPFKIGHWIDLSFFAGAVFLVLILSRSMQFVDVPMPELADTPLVTSETARYVGASFVILGIVIFLGALISFGNSWRVGIDTRTSGALVTSGLFSVSRNPIFVFIDLYLIGTFLLNGTLVFLVIAVAGIVGVHLQILREEQFLEKRYGADYARYRSQTPRYFVR